MDGYCGKCTGISAVVVGALILIKEWAFVNLSWGAFVGLLIVFIGIMRIIKPTCGCKDYCCAPPVEQVKMVQKAKKK